MRNMWKRTISSLVIIGLLLNFSGCGTEEFAEVFSRIENSIKEEISSEYRGAEDTQAVWEDADIEKKKDEDTTAAPREDLNVNYAYSTLDDETRHFKP